MTDKIVIKPHNNASGFSSEPFPVVERLPVIRSAFNESAKAVSSRSAKNAPLVFAMPIGGIIEHAQEGVNIDKSEFQNGNAKMRAIWGENKSRNKFKDLPFSIKPSKEKNGEGEHDYSQYLLKVKLPGSNTTDWKKLSDAKVDVLLGASRARYSQDEEKDVLALQISIDPQPQVEDPGFGDFNKKSTKKEAPYVLTFEIPEYIDAEKLKDKDIKYPKGLSDWDLKRGHLNIILPVKDEESLDNSVNIGPSR